MLALPQYYDLYNSKRPEVISRLMPGQLNFLPLRKGTIHGSLQLSLVLISRSLKGFPPKSSGRDRLSQTTHTRLAISYGCALLLLLPGRQQRVWSHCEAVGRGRTIS